MTEDQNKYSNLESFYSDELKKKNGLVAELANEMEKKKIKRGLKNLNDFHLS